MYLTLFEVYVCVCTRKGSALISVRRAKEVGGGKANTFLARVSELSYIPISECVSQKINIKMRNGKCEIHSPVICQKKNKKKI